jgi:hypothetical protein
MSQSQIDSLTTILSAIFLDDDIESRRLVKEKFNEFNIQLDAVKNIGEFLKSYHKYPIILCDLDLKTFNTDKSGATILLEVRKLNNTAFLAIFTAYEYKITKEEREKLQQNNIKIYSKHDNADIKNLKVDYKRWKDSIIPEVEKYSLVTEHHRLNKKIVLEHLKNISNKSMMIPVISLKKLFTYEQLLKEISNDTEVGHAFILEFIERISYLNKINKN